MDVEREVVRKNRIFALKGVLFSLIFLAVLICIALQHGRNIGNRIAQFIACLPLPAASILLFFWLKRLFSPDTFPYYEPSYYEPSYYEPEQAHNLNQYKPLPGDLDIAEYSLKQKRVAIKYYLRKNSGHDAFVTREGRFYEVQIMEVDREAIEFVWAYSPITDNACSDPETIPIEEIVLLVGGAKMREAEDAMV